MASNLRPDVEVSARRFLFVLLLGSIVLVAMVVRPLGFALFMAAVVAVVLARTQQRLAARLGGRPNLSAAILVILTLLLIVGPLAGLSAVLVKEGVDGAKFIYETFRSEGATGLVGKLPEWLQGWVTRAQEYLGDLQRFLERLGDQGGKAASVVGSALAATGSLVFDLVMMLIALFFLLAEGDRLVDWIDSVSPLRRGQTRELMAEFKKVSYAVMVSTLITAGVQAAVALVGYFIASVPHPIFFGAVTFFVAMIPAVGATSVVLVAALVLLLTGHPYMAIFLAAWGVLVVGLVDNVVKPYLIKGDVEMSGAVVFFALVGGIGAFGMVGLLIGPLAVALFLAILRIYRRDYLPQRE
jgi:predicted PurR-regulated permease PerM